MIYRSNLSLNSISLFYVISLIFSITIEFLSFQVKLEKLENNIVLKIKTFFECMMEDSINGCMAQNSE